MKKFMKLFIIAQIGFLIADCILCFIFGFKVNDITVSHVALSGVWICLYIQTLD